MSRRSLDQPFSEANSGDFNEAIPASGQQRHHGPECKAAEEFRERLNCREKMREIHSDGFHERLVQEVKAVTINANAPELQKIEHREMGLPVAEIFADHGCGQHGGQGKEKRIERPGKVGGHDEEGPEWH